MKKLLIVIPSLIQGGGQKFVLDFARFIDKTQYQVKILLYYDAISPIFEDVVKDLENENVEIIKLNKKKGLDFKFFKKVKKIIRTVDPDIIHTHIDTLLYLLPTFKRKQVKIHTVHTIANEEAKGFQKIVRWLAFKIFKVIPVAISNMVADTLSDYYHIKKEKIPVIYNGVDCKKYAVNREKKDTINIISVGNIYGVKNFAYLIECFYEISKKHTNTTLTIVGDGVLRKDIEAQIEKLQISEKVFLIGAVFDVGKYLAKADIYASSSLFEGLPISILEAMASGLPVVANSVGGIPDIIKDKENGYLIPLNDKDSYINALDSLISSEETRNKFSANTLEFVKQYDEAEIVKQYQNLYQKNDAK